MGLRRGDIVTAAPPGSFGKPRPVLVLHDVSDVLDETITVALITSKLERLPALPVLVNASALNGLRLPSEVMADMIHTFPIGKIGRRIGELDPMSLRLVDNALKLHLQLS